MMNPYPAVISIHHDGIEVCRNESGRWIDLPTADKPDQGLPLRVQFFFDGALVYDLNQGVVEKNELKMWITKSSAR